MLPKSEPIRKSLIIDKSIDDKLGILSKITNKNKTTLINRAIKDFIKDNILHFKEYYLIEYFYDIINGNLNEENESMEIKIDDIFVKVVIKENEEKNDYIFELTSDIGGKDKYIRICKNTDELEKQLSFLSMYISENNSVIQNYFKLILESIEVD